MIAVAKIVAVLALVGGMLFLGLQWRSPVEQHIGYWSIDDRTLGVVVLDSPNLSCAVAGVDESVDAVRIHARCNERVIPVSGTGMAQQYVFQVALQVPLAGRSVYDGTGTPAQACQKPAPDCWYSG